MARVAILKKTIETIKLLVETLECVEIEHDTNFDDSKRSTNTQLFQSIKRLWDDTIFQERLRLTEDCVAILNVVRISIFFVERLLRDNDFITLL